MYGRGILERATRGVYRFRDVPRSDEDRFMAAVLWPQDATGTLSHASAIELYDVSDIAPRRVHITLPREMKRRRREVPEHLQIHYEDLLQAEATRYRGIPVVTPERAIREIIATRIDHRFVDQAITGALGEGLLTRTEARRLRQRARRAAAAMPIQSNDDGAAP